MLLPTSIISVLFSCRIQSCIGYSYSVDCCLCWERQRMRIGFPQQKERAALMFSTCQRSSPLHLGLTASPSVMVTYLLSLFLLSFWRDIFVMLKLLLVVCNAMAALHSAFCCHNWVLKGAVGGRKKRRIWVHFLGPRSQFGLEGNLGHGMMW